MISDAPIDRFATIAEAIAARDVAVRPCVSAARQRGNDPRAEITIDIGIDPAGELIGAKPERGAAPDDELASCIVAALHGAHFPPTDGGAIVATQHFMANPNGGR